MSVTWDTYLPQVMPHATGIPRVRAVDAVRKAAIEFAARSLIWRQTLDPIDVVEDTGDYTLAPPSGSRPVTVLYAEYNGTPITPLPEEHLDHVSPTWRAQGTVVHHYYLPDPLTFSLSWLPDEDITDGLIVRLALKPTPASTDGPDLLYYDWYQEIASGALSMLQAEPGQRWSTEAGSKMNERAFKAGIEQARFRAAASHTRAGLRVKMRPFA